MQMYDISDSCLNEIWNLVKYNTSEESSMRFSLSRENGLQTKKQRGNEILDQTMDLRHRWTAVLRWQSLPWSVVEELAGLFEVRWKRGHLADFK